MQEEKRCGRCKQYLPLSEFCASKYTKSGYANRCKKCDCEQHKLAYNDPHKVKQRLRKLRKHSRWYHSVTKDRNAKGLCQSCANPTRPGFTRCGDCAKRACEDTNRRREILKDECFRAYGGYVCACCGETEKVFLTIDHVNGGGNDHRRELWGTTTPGSLRLYFWLRKNKFPEGFQVLCYNCNIGKHRCGVCPHKSKDQS